MFQFILVSIQLVNNLIVFMVEDFMVQHVVHSQCSHSIYVDLSIYMEVLHIFFGLLDNHCILSILKRNSFNNNYPRNILENMMKHLDWVGTGRVLSGFLNGLLIGLHH